MKRFIIFLTAFNFCLGAAIAAPVKAKMYSNKRVIKFTVNSKTDDWTISPELNPDILFLYSPTEKTKFVKFVSNIDSIEFTVNVNDSVDFAVILNQKDTAYTRVVFTNQIANTLSETEKIRMLSEFWSEAKYNFVFIDKLTFDWDSLYQAYIPKVLAAKNDFEFYDLMDLFATSLKDLHTDVSWMNFGRYAKYCPLTVEYFGDSLFVTNSHKNFVPLGSKILKINDFSFDKYMEKEVIPYINSDFKPTVKSLAESRLFMSDLDSKKMNVTYQTPDGKIVTQLMPRNNAEGMDELIGKTSKYSRNLVDIEWLEDGIARVAINTFYPEEKVISLFESIKDTLYSAKGIMIDLRENRGGSTGTALHVLNHIIKTPYYLTFAYQTRINNSVKKANGNFIEENEDFFKNRAYQTFLPDTMHVPDSIKQFDCPIVVLISEKTCSAAEDFLIILAERPDRPKFIGRPSMGSTGSPLVLWDFPENVQARMCARRVLYPYSLKPFTEGITPDILVEYTYDEYMRDDYDKDVEVAVEELKKMISK
jgi:hypothetical protein